MPTSTTASAVLELSGRLSSPHGPSDKVPTDSVFPPGRRSQGQEAHLPLPFVMNAAFGEKHEILDRRADWPA
jgi:hypothetical protein